MLRAGVHRLANDALIRRELTMGDDHMREFYRARQRNQLSWLEIFAIASSYAALVAWAIWANTR